MTKMKITAGLGALEDYERLADAGADEFFAGYVPLDWLEKYANLTPLNRREVLMHPLQFDTPGEMRLLARKIQRRGVPVSLTFNSICYHPEQYPAIGQMLRMLGDLGFRDWIMADPGLILYLKEHNIEGRILLSGEAGCFNPDAMRFFSRLGIRRCIFPRKITPEEMSACIRAVPHLEYEAFALNERCHYSGAFCASLHCDELGHLCQVPYLPVGPDVHEAAPADSDETAFGAGGCALCALDRLRRAGVTYLKVVGRGANIDLLERDVRTLRCYLDAQPKGNIQPQDCSGNCYYPPD